MTSATLRPIAALMIGSLLVASDAALAEKKYGPGVTDTEIKIGQTMPYSGPLSGLGTIGRAELAYFDMINAQGGVNGRKIRLISLDDGYNPAKTVEQTRKLIEDEGVLLLFGSLGTPTNTAIHKYVNAKHVPHLFPQTGATKWGDPKHFPWTMGGLLLPYQTEGRIYARYILQSKPDARIAVLYQNDDFGKDYVKGFKDELGDKAAHMIVAEASYEVTDPMVDSQIISLQASGADMLFDVTTPKASVQTIRKVYEIGWNPLHVIRGPGTSVGAVLAPAGLEKSVGLISAQAYKDPTDPVWKDDPGMKNWLAWMKAHYPQGDVTDDNNVNAYVDAQVLVQVLRQCGDDLTRENVMRQAANLRNLELDMLLPGIRINTSPTDYFPIEQAQMRRFDGKEWVLFGGILGVESH
ncbi:MAG TPA: ABC transporter substrate-binding protein [Burkholderiales bacterium]|nr:ABC transporter substrate-binding protein [Burkholderiales bacterium]